MVAWGGQMRFSFVWDAGLEPILAGLGLMRKANQHRCWCAWKVDHRLSSTELAAHRERLHCKRGHFSCSLTRLSCGSHEGPCRGSVAMPCNSGYHYREDC